ncbi:hypothetical protein KUCAC02_032599, partial [Chaenocephalus aceratus]
EPSQDFDSDTLPSFLGGQQDYLECHISEPHQYSVKNQVSLASGYSAMQAFEPTVIMEHEAVIGGFKCLYWLLKSDQRNNYQSHRIVDEMLEILAQIVELPILEEIRSSQAISLEVDETTDVSELPVDRLYGLGTDGAAVMTGRLNGVAKQLPDSFPKPVSVACAAHRLALACKDASNAVGYMAHFRNHLQADVLPHIAMLSKVFQRADVNFLHIKEQGFFNDEQGGN